MRHGHGHPAQNSGWPVRVLHTAPAGGSCLLIPYSRSILASLTSLALAQSTAVTIITSADVKDSGEFLLTKFWQGIGHGPGSDVGNGPGSD